MQSKVIQRGSYQLVPACASDVPEIVKHLSIESARELKLLGYSSVKEGIEEMVSSAECYIARRDGCVYSCVGGLFHGSENDDPQMFAMFSGNIRDNFIPIARGSKTLVKLFDKFHPRMTMTILSEHEAMLNWALWLGFEVVSTMNDTNNHEYINFVRCNPSMKDAYSGESRPVMH